MSLYLCIFDDDEELGGVSVGAYSDFGDFRETIHKMLETGKWGSRFPTLLLHSDCDGEWTVANCIELINELKTIGKELKQLPPKKFFSQWQNDVAKRIGLTPGNLYDCFIDVDGEPLIERLTELAIMAQHRGLPILFQ